MYTILTAKFMAELNDIVDTNIITQNILPSNKTESPIEFININQSILILDNKKEGISRTEIIDKEIAGQETGNIGNDYYNVEQSKILDYKDYEYNKKWIKLDKQQKINRLMHYIQTLNITDTEKFAQLQILLVDLVMNKCIKNFCIDYSESEGIVTGIPDLKYSTTSNIYYIGTDVRDISITIKECTAPLKPFKALNLKAMFATK